MTYEHLTYNRTYHYPSWALRFGWLLSLSSIACIPIYAVCRFIMSGGSFNERFKKLRKSRIKSHQIGLSEDVLQFKTGDEQSNGEQLLRRENESNLENINVALIDSSSTNSAGTDAPNLAAPVTSGTPPNNNSTSEDDNLSSCANSRTLFKALP